MQFNYIEQLNRHQIAQIDALQQNCRQVDSNIIPIYRHLLQKPRPFPSNVLCYKDNTLIGFLRAFFFQEQTAELAIMVEPKYRKQGIATKMLETIIPLLQQQDVQNLTVSVPYAAHNTWLTALGFKKGKTQYVMQYDVTRPLTSAKNIANIRVATNADLSALCTIHQSGFPKENANMYDYFASLLHDPDYVIFVIENNWILLGKAHIRFEAQSACLADLAVLNEQRGQGYGTALIKHSIYYSILRNHTCIFLDIEEDNKRAFKLYSQLGFYITNKHDYWSIPINFAEFNLTHFLKTI